MSTATLRAEGKNLRPVCILVTTGTSGAKVQITSDKSISAAAMFVKPFTGAGACYIGTSGLVASTGVELIADMPTVPITFFLQSQNGVNDIAPADYWIQGTNTGDKVIVTYWIA